MNYQRIYLLSLLGVGLIFVVVSVSALRGGSSLLMVLFAVAGIGMVLSSAYDLTFADNPAGPTSPNWQFFSAVGGFILSLTGLTISLLL